MKKYIYYMYVYVPGRTFRRVKFEQIIPINQNLNLRCGHRKQSKSLC